ncbi:MAG: class II aldolase/adducin family protein [Clostridia bacterium]|nr:class II aldolase/adducin family protein [Clostridia bacterium]
MMFPAERRLMVNTCLKLQAMDYFIGTWGNISLRAEDRILLTPSRVAYDAMRPEDIVVIDMEGRKLEGSRNPTSEKEVHRQIYRKRADVRAIIHAHTSGAMAVSAADVEEVPCLAEEMSQLLGGSIPVTPVYICAERHSELGEAAAAAIGDRNAVILRNHGSVACGRDLTEALLAARVQEKACGLYLRAAAAGIPLRAIPDEQVSSERFRYLHTYGKENM